MKLSDNITKTFGLFFGRHGIGIHTIKHDLPSTLKR